MGIIHFGSERPRDEGDWESRDPVGVTLRQERVGGSTIISLVAVSVACVLYALVHRGPDDRRFISLSCRSTPSYQARLRQLLAEAMFWPECEGGKNRLVENRLGTNWRGIQGGATAVVFDEKILEPPDGVLPLDAAVFILVVAAASSVG